MDENPEDEGLLEFLLTGLALVADLLASDEEEFTDNDVLKWCLLPARTEMIKKEQKLLYTVLILFILQQVVLLQCMQFDIFFILHIARKKWTFFLKQIIDILYNIPS